MPHTSHKKTKQRTKRTVVEGDDGWTRVTTTNNAQRQPRPLPAQRDHEEQHSHSDSHDADQFQPTPVPTDKTIEQLEEQFRKVEKNWLDSQSYKAMKRCLRDMIDIEVLRSIDTCVVFGTGSFCGYVRGWIERFEVSLYQLAAFKSVVDVIGVSHVRLACNCRVTNHRVTESLTGHRPQACAQEPRYNDLDVDLLLRLQVNCVRDPAGFEILTPRSFVYAPNAELDVTLRSLACDPAITMVNSKIDYFWRNAKGEACTNMIYVTGKGNTADVKRIGCSHEADGDEQLPSCVRSALRDMIEEGLQTCERFMQDKCAQSLPSLDAKDEPFFDVHMYYRRTQELSDEQGAQAGPSSA